MFPADQMHTTGETTLQAYHRGRREGRALRRELRGDVQRIRLGRSACLGRARKLRGAERVAVARAAELGVARELR